MAERLLEEYRGGTLENVHYGHVAVVGESGEVVLRAGDPEWVSFLRSAAKPFQAIPAFLHGVDAAFGLTDREKAVMTASHRAEPMHVEALECLLAKVGLPETCLVCAESYPLSQQARDAVLLAGGAKRRLYHNCSGKHLGILGLCRLMGYETDGYADPAHPAQREILRIVSLFSGVREEEIRLGTDGCGLPVFALPLSRIAAMYLKLACPDLIPDPAASRAAAEVGRVMNGQADLVSAPWFICSNLLKDPNIVAKGGAKGVYGFALRRERIAVALKVLDGSEEPWPLIIASILEQLGYAGRETIDRMRQLGQPVIRNDGGIVVGERRAEFQLR